MSIKIWYQTVSNGFKCIEMISNGFELSQMDLNWVKCIQMNSNDFKLFQMDSNVFKEAYTSLNMPKSLLKLHKIIDLKPFFSKTAPQILIKLCM